MKEKADDCDDDDERTAVEIRGERKNRQTERGYEELLLSSWLRVLCKDW